MIIFNFDENVEYVFNQVFGHIKKPLSVGARVFAWVFPPGSRLYSNLHVGARVFAWVFPALAPLQKRVKVHPRMCIGELLCGEVCYTSSL